MSEQERRAPEQRAQTDHTEATSKSLPSDHIDNASYFILPCRIDSMAVLDGYLKHAEKWEEIPEKFRTEYLLYYASSMNAPGDERFRRFRYTAPEELPLCMFRDRMSDLLSRKGPKDSISGCVPTLDEISLYVFGSGIAFLEFRILYGSMSIPEILYFVNLFRSLRNDEAKDYLRMGSGEIGLKTAAERILPADASGTELCFSNPSAVKMQANVYSMLDVRLCSSAAENGIDPDHCSYLLAHGYYAIDPTDLALANSYEMRVHLKQEEYWRGSQDGLACVTEKSYRFQADHLNTDYHFIYLMLLNQRFAAVSYIKEMSLPGQDLESTREIHQKVVALKTRYSFRVLTDDFFMQTVYNGMYQVLELDNLVKDLGEGNEKLNAVVQEAQEARERRLSHWLSMLSILAIFSALVDLADYLLKWFNWDGWLSAAVSLAAVLVVILVAWFRRK